MTVCVKDRMEVWLVLVVVAVVQAGVETLGLLSLLWSLTLSDHWDRFVTHIGSISWQNSLMFGSYL